MANIILTFIELIILWKETCIESMDAVIRLGIHYYFVAQNKDYTYKWNKHTICINKLTYTLLQQKAVTKMPSTGDFFLWASWVADELDSAKHTLQRLLFWSALLPAPQLSSSKIPTCPNTWRSSQIFFKNCKLLYRIPLSVFSNNLDTYVNEKIIDTFLLKNYLTLI
jgi:hypothetical protein